MQFRLSLAIRLAGTFIASTSIAEELPATPPPPAIEALPPSERRLEFFIAPGVGVSYMFSGRGHSPTPPAVSDADDALKLGGLLAVQAGVLGRESGFGLAAFYELHTRSTTAETPFTQSGTCMNNAIRSFAAPDEGGSGTCSKTHSKFEPSLRVHAFGLELVKRGRFGASDLHWNGAFGVGYVFSLLEVSQAGEFTGAYPSTFSNDYRQTSDGIALLGSVGLDWSISPHLAIGTELRYLSGEVHTQELLACEMPLLGVADQRVDHLALTAGVRFGI